MENQYYLILSEGAYSDYSPIYYVGDKEITYNEFLKKGKEIGDEVINEWESLPERPHICKDNYCCVYTALGKPKKTEKYDPNDLKRYISNSGPMSNDWFDKMEKWIFSQGFKKIPDNIPELNSSYSEFPSNKYSNII